MSSRVKKAHVEYLFYWLKSQQTIYVFCDSGPLLIYSYPILQQFIYRLYFPGDAAPSHIAAGTLHSAILTRGGQVSPEYMANSFAPTQLNRLVLPIKI